MRFCCVRFENRLGDLGLLGLPAASLEEPVEASEAYTYFVSLVEKMDSRLMSDPEHKRRDVDEVHILTHPPSMGVPPCPWRCHGRSLNAAIQPHILMLVTISDDAVPVSFWSDWDLSTGGIVGVVVASHFRC